MVSLENLAYLKHHGRTHPTWTDELPINVTCHDSGHPYMLRHKQWNGSQFLATVSESASDSGVRSSVGWVVAALQVQSRVRGLGAKEVPNERSPILSFSHYQTVCVGWSIIAIYRDSDQMKSMLEHGRALRHQPLPLHDLSRISIRKAVGGRHLKKSVRQLPLPPKMKEFVRTNIMPLLLAKYGI